MRTISRTGRKRRLSRARCGVDCDQASSFDDHRLTKSEAGRLFLFFVPSITFFVTTRHSFTRPSPFLTRSPSFNNQPLQLSSLRGHLLSQLEGEPAMADDSIYAAYNTLNREDQASQAVANALLAPPIVVRSPFAFEALLKKGALSPSALTQLTLAGSLSEQGWILHFLFYGAAASSCWEYVATPSFRTDSHRKKVSSPEQRRQLDASR